MIFLIEVSWMFYYVWYVSGMFRTIEKRGELAVYSRYQSCVCIFTVVIEFAVHLGLITLLAIDEREMSGIRSEAVLDCLLDSITITAFRNVQSYFVFISGPLLCFIVIGTVLSFIKFVIVLYAHIARRKLHVERSMQATGLKMHTQKKKP